MSKTNSLPNARLSPEVRLQRSADFSSRHCTSIGDALVVSGFSMFERERPGSKSEDLHSHKSPIASLVEYSMQVSRRFFDVFSAVEKHTYRPNLLYKNQTWTRVRKRRRQLPFSGHGSSNGLVA